jgi:rhodanese-related sulfurtransferase
MVKTQLINILVPIMIFTAMLFNAWGQENEAHDITVEQVQEKIKAEEELILLDVRTGHEFEGPLGHISGAVLIPISELESRLDEIGKYKDKELIVYCKYGGRSKRATKILREQGFDAVNMVGGILAWNEMLSSVAHDSLKVDDEKIIK